MTLLVYPSNLSGAVTIFQGSTLSLLLQLNLYIRRFCIIKSEFNKAQKIKNGEIEGKPVYHSAKLSVQLNQRHQIL